MKERTLPYQVTEMKSDVLDYGIVDAEGREVVGVCGVVNKETADAIVLACNNHQAMKDALEAARKLPSLYDSLIGNDLLVEVRQIRQQIRLIEEQVKAALAPLQKEEVQL
jgi:hypothetical protein